MNAVREKTWIELEVEKGVEEWRDVRAASGIPAPTSIEVHAYELGFAAGAHAGMTRVEMLLTRDAG